MPSDWRACRAPSRPTASSPRGAVGRGLCPLWLTPSGFTQTPECTPQLSITPASRADVIEGCGEQGSPPAAAGCVSWGVREGGFTPLVRSTALSSAGAKQGRRGEGLGPLSPLGCFPKQPYSNRRSGGPKGGQSPPLIGRALAGPYNEGAPSGHPNTYVCVRRASPHARTRAALMGPTAPGPHIV